MGQRVAQKVSHRGRYSDPMTEHELAELAHARGLRLQRSAVTDPAAVPAYGVCWLLDARTGLRVWPDRRGADLVDCGMAGIG